MHTEWLYKNSRLRLASLGILIAFAVTAWVAHQSQIAGERRRYAGHSVREWVDLALAEKPMSLDGKPAHMIRRIGSAAVPHLVARLRDLQDGPLRERLLIWQNEHLPNSCQWLDCPPNEDAQVLKIVRLLAEFGPAAGPAVPVMIRAAGEVHYGVYREILNCLADMGSAANEAIPWLRRMVDEGGDEDFHAAWALLKVAPHDTTLQRLLVRAIEVERKPTLADDELTLARDEARLNRILVPRLADLLCDRSVSDEERMSAARHLGERGLDAASALPVMRTAAAQANSPELAEEINEAIEEIVEADQTRSPAAEQGTPGR